MTFDSILKLFGGLALFLYGMHMMSSGLEGAAGDRMKSILEKLTSNRFLGIIAVSYTHLDVYKRQTYMYAVFTFSLYRTDSGC